MSETVHLTPSTKSFVSILEEIPGAETSVQKRPNDTPILIVDIPVIASIISTVEFPNIVFFRLYAISFEFFSEDSVTRMVVDIYNGHNRKLLQTHKCGIPCSAPNFRQNLSNWVQNINKLEKLFVDDYIRAVLYPMVVEVQSISEANTEINFVRLVNSTQLQSLKKIFQPNEVRELHIE